MGILVRDEKIDRQIRELAAQDGLSLQAAIGMAVEQELTRRSERRKRIEAALASAQAKLAKFPLRADDGLTDKEFFDREYGDT